MKLERVFSTSKPTSILKVILSDPAFIIPKIFRSTQDYEIHGNSFNITAKYSLLRYKVYGNIYIFAAK
ncbi:STK_08120 family protein [Metallosphaera sedula]|uniref:STK_08120 family protein n=1 Tax=Metallosphaera sedula TaxID=43687 RepID=UPI00384C935E